MTGVQALQAFYRFQQDWLYACEENGREPELGNQDANDECTALVRSMLHASGEKNIKAEELEHAPDAECSYLKKGEEDPTLKFIDRDDDL